MSRYIRDDKTFRAQIAELAALKLNFPTNPNKLQATAVEFPLLAPGSLGPGTGRKSALYPKQWPLGHVPTAAEVHADNVRVAQARGLVEPEIKPKGKFPEVVAGVVMGIVVLGIIVVLTLAGLGLVTLLGGAH